MSEIRTRVIGVGNLNQDGTSRQKILLKHAGKGKEAVLCLAEGKPTNPNAIQVMLAGDGKKNTLHQVGFLPGRVCDRLARVINKSGEVTAVIEGLTTTELSKHTGISLKITY